MTTNEINLADAIEAQSAAADKDYSAALEFDIEYNGKTYQAGPSSYEAMLAASVQPDLPPDFYWVDKDNNKVPFSKQQIIELSNLVFLRRLELFNQLQDKKTRYRAATSIAELFNLNTI